jgi:hypothetical protein
MREIKEYDLVVLKSNLVTRDATVAAGSCGTVVSVYRNGEAFAVEFDDPEPCVVEVEAGMIAPAS